MRESETMQPLPCDYCNQPSCGSINKYGDIVEEIYKRTKGWDPICFECLDDLITAINPPEERGGGWEQAK